MRASRLLLWTRLTFVALATLALMPLQALAVARGWRLAGRLPVVYHRFVLKLLGIRIETRGAPAAGRPLLVVANHVSWLDILVIGSLAPLSFVARADMRGWPAVGLLARLQRTIFVDRTRRTATRGANRTIAERLRRGDPIVLFGEGTTGDGNRVLPFRSALLGAAREAMGAEGAGTVTVQPLAIAYPRRDGLPLGRAGRPAVAWYGGMDLAPHLAGIVGSGGIDAVAVWGEPVAVDAASDRKALAERLEAAVRAKVCEITTGRPPLPGRAPAPPNSVIASTRSLRYSQSRPAALNKAEKTAR